ncbi:MAG: aldo/keto reductase, partial [Pseudomonadota bacterium]
WLLHQRVVTSVILGATRVDQLTDNIGATEIALSSDDLDALDAASRLPSEYPGWMIERQTASVSDLLEEKPRGATAP